MLRAHLFVCRGFLWQTARNLLARQDRLLQSGECGGGQGAEFSEGPGRKGRDMGVLTRSFHRIAAAVMAVAVGLAFPLAAWAQQRGPVTNLPLPRFVSLKTNEANARRGPDLSHRIDWVYKTA